MVCTMPAFPMELSTEPVEIESKDQGLLDSFWALADIKDSAREDAIVALLRQVYASENETATLNYVLNRLIRGLSSTHKAARLGFYTALVHLLRLFVSIEPLECIRLLKKHHRSTLDDGATCHASVGLCLGYAALVRSRQLHKHPEVMRQVVSELMSQCSTETFRELCSTLLVELINEADESVFKSFLWPSFQSHFESGWEDCTCEKLWLVIVCSEKFPKLLTKKYFMQVWGGKSVLLHAESLKSIAKLFLRSSSSHPRVHPMCSTVLHALSSSTQSFDTLISFWDIFTDVAFGKQQRKEKAYLAFELLKGLLDLARSGKLACSGFIRGLMRPCIVQSVVHSLPHPHVVMHGAAVQLTNALVAFVSHTDNASCQLEVVECLLRPPGSYSFDQITHSATIASMIVSLKADAVRGLIVLTKDAFLESDATGDLQRSSALHLLSRILGTSPIAKVDVEIQTDILQFFAFHAFFDHVKETSEIPQCGKMPSGTISSSLRQKARSGLLACIASLSARGLGRSNPAKGDVQSADVADAAAVSGRRRLLLEVLYANFVYVGRLLRSPEIASLVLDESRQPRVREAYDDAVRIVQGIWNSGTMTSNRPDSRAFILLFVHLGIHLLIDETDTAITALKDVQVCYSKLKGDGSRSVPSDEPDWILVVVDLLLELMASTSEVGRMRSIVRDIFALLVDPHLTIAALDHILQVVDSKDGAESSDVDDESMSDEEEGDVVKEEGAVDENSSGEEDEDEVDDIADGDCNGTLRDAVKAALGNAADDSDRDDDSGSDSDVYLDDDAMMQLDETLAEAFRSALVKRPSRPSARLDEETVHFRHRCFDLIETVISLRPSVPFLLRILLPMISTVEHALKDKVQLSIGQKALACLRRICQVKRLRDEQLDGNIATDGFGDILRELVARFRRVSDYETSLVIAETCTFVVRCALRADQQTAASSGTDRAKIGSDSRQNKRKRKADDDTCERTGIQGQTPWHLDECIEIYRQTLRDYFDNRERHTPHQMFTSLVKKYLHIGWQLADVLQEYAFQPEVRLFKRTKAVTMLLSIMADANLVVQVVGADHWSAISDDLQTKISISLEALISDVKPRCVAELCHLAVNVATLDRKYSRPLDTDKWTAVLGAAKQLSDAAAVRDLPKDAKRQIKRVCSVLFRREGAEAKAVHKGSSTSEGQSSKTRTKKKIRKSEEDSL